MVDEPAAGLDPEERIRFRVLISEVAGHTAVLLSTHIVEDVEATCPRLVVIGAGRSSSTARRPSCCAAPPAGSGGCRGGEKKKSPPIPALRVTPSRRSAGFIPSERAQPVRSMVPWELSEQRLPYL